MLFIHMVYCFTHDCCFHTDFLFALSFIASRIIDSRTTLLLMFSILYLISIIIYIINVLTQWVHTYLKLLKFFLNWHFHYYVMKFFISCDSFWLELFDVWFKNGFISLAYHLRVIPLLSTFRLCISIDQNHLYYLLSLTISLTLQYFFHFLS